MLNLLTLGVRQSAPQSRISDEMDTVRQLTDNTRPV